MERNSLSNMKDRDRSNNKDKVKDSWDCNKNGFDGDYPGGFSWPPRSYRCSFCKREFRSAQALGGHMNVHRRDRARLRQSPPLLGGQCPNLNLNLNLNLNPNPNFSSASPSAMVPPLTYTFPSLLSPSHTCFSSPSSASISETKLLSMANSWQDPLSLKSRDLSKVKSMKDLFGVQELKGFTQEDECKILKKEESVRLDLEISLIKDSKEDLDLELRLGYT